MTMRFVFIPNEHVPVKGETETIEIDYMGVSLSITFCKNTFMICSYSTTTTRHNITYKCVRDIVRSSDFAKRHNGNDWYSCAISDNSNIPFLEKLARHMPASDFMQFSLEA